MATTKTPAAPATTTATGTTQKPQQPAAAPAQPPVTSKELVSDAKAKKTKQKVFYPTADAAKDEAASRDKGWRKAFTVKMKGGKERHLVAYDAVYAAGICAIEDDLADVTPLSQAEKKPKAPSVDAAMAIVNALPAADRDAVLAQLKALTGTKS